MTRKKNRKVNKNQNIKNVQTQAKSSKRGNTKARPLKKSGMAKRILSGAGEIIGSSFGPLGSQVGSYLGGKAGELFSTITGYGTYKIHKNSFLTGMGNGTNNIPTFSPDSSLVVSSRSMMSTVKSSATSSGADYQVSSYDMSPSNSAFTEWLASFASSFEQYEFLGIVIAYVPLSGNATGADTSLGQVTLCSNMDPDDPPYVDMKSAENSSYASTASPDKPQMLFIECARNSSPTNVSFTGVPQEGESKKFFSHGTFQVATSGMQTANQTLGSIWCSAHVRFSNPKENPFSGECAVFQSSPTSGSSFGTGAVRQLGSSQIIQVLSDPLLAAPISISKSGRYIVVATLEVTGTISACTNFSAGANASTVDNYINNTAPGFWSCGSGTSYEASFTAMFDIVTHTGADGAGIINTGTFTFSGSIVGSDLQVLEVPPNFGNASSSEESNMMRLTSLLRSKFPNEAKLIQPLTKDHSLVQRYPTKGSIKTKLYEESQSNPNNSVINGRTYVVPRTPNYDPNPEGKWVQVSDL